MTDKATPPINLRVEQEPYPHLRDDQGCVLARDYQSPAKLAYILNAVNAHDAMRQALEEAQRMLSTCDFDQPEDIAALEQIDAALELANGKS